MGEFVEQFNEKLLLKQEDSPLKIIDLLTRSVVTVKNQHFRTPSVIIFTQNQDVILSLCEESCAGSIKSPSKGLPPSAAGRVSIHVSHILSGRCLAKIDWKSADPSNLTALCYNEERGDIITGNTQGLLHVWTN